MKLGWKKVPFEVLAQQVQVRQFCSKCDLSYLKDIVPRTNVLWPSKLLDQFGSGLNQKTIFVVQKIKMKRNFYFFTNQEP